MPSTGVLFSHHARPVGALAVFLALSLAGPVSAAITLGQRDDFEDRTTGDWDNGGSAADPTNETGGPAGSNRFMRVTSDGSGPGGRLSIFSRFRWVGDYLTPGVTAIEMDLRNFGASTFQIRLGLKQGANQGDPGYSSTVPFTLPDDGQWHHAVFGLDAASLTEIGSVSGGLAGLLGAGPDGFQEFRILHSTTPSLMGNNITAILGVDNITAIPTPSVATLLAAAGLAACARRRRA